MRTAIIRAEISRFIDAHYREDISMQDAAAALRYSDAYFCKLFKQCFKVNFSAYLNEYRVNKARQLILDPRLSLKDIGAAVGYSDANYFTKGVQAPDRPDPFGIPRSRSGKSGTRINRIQKKRSFFPACEQERNGCFCFASFFVQKHKNCTWIQQRQNRTAFHKIIRFHKMNELLKYNHRKNVKREGCHS